MKTKRLMLAAIAAIGLALPSAAETYILDKAQRSDTVAGHGYDLVAAPVYYSVKVPDGRYRVTFEIGSPKKAAETTVRAESRRLFVENLATRKGETVRKSFVVDKRSPYIDAETSVRLKPREKGKLDWDDRLTFEIGGENPAVRSITVEPAEDVTTVYLCGNSTVVDQEEEPWASWGQMVTRFFDDKVAVANYAESGESANTFIAARRLKRALRDARKGDWMFVEFGHNDQKQKGPGKGAWYSYLTSLKTFIDEARLKGVNIVLVTPTRRRVFDEYGRSVNTHEEFPDAMR
ncbi:MAG: rhamnogalacturonan acetylesterase, partial [Duncaniella sp.]|nr:rhamnogalacturonan acetylesterase [Duncaniella sp.]